MSARRRRRARRPPTPLCGRCDPPPVGGLLDSENCSCPLCQKPVQKWFLPQKGGSLSVEGVFAKKFSGAGEDSAVGAYVRLQS
jgi:hypothetical protein